MKTADVCGEVKRPDTSKSDITLRIVADDRETSKSPDSVFDPIGSPRSR